MTIKDSIKRKYIRLSKGQRKVAQFAIDNPTVIATQVAAEVGRLAGVSESTVIRFCYAMDYTGFSEFQLKMREFLIESGILIDAVQGHEKKPSLTKTDSMAQDIEEIATMMKNIDVSKLVSAAQLIHTSEQVHIIGLSQFTPAANWFYDQLHKLQSNVFMHVNGNFVQDSFQDSSNLSQAVAVLFIEKKQIHIVQQLISDLKQYKIKVIALAYNDDYQNEKNIDVLIEIGAGSADEDLCSVGVFSVLRAITTNYTALASKQAEQSLVPIA